MIETSKVLFDNTSFAGTGRAIYAGDSFSKGGSHAADYYELYADAIAEDQRSLAELLTALVLFDELLWEGSSFLSQEIQEMNDDMPGKHDDFSNAWVYSWFPVFSEAHREGVIKHHFARNAGMQLPVARKRAVQWASSRLKEGKIEFPKNFRIPLCYKRPS